MPSHSMIDAGVLLCAHCAGRRCAPAPLPRLRLPLHLTRRCSVWHSSRRRCHLAESGRWPKGLTPRLCGYCGCTLGMADALALLDIVIRLGTVPHAPLTLLSAARSGAACLGGLGARLPLLTSSPPRSSRAAWSVGQTATRRQRRPLRAQPGARRPARRLTIPRVRHAPPSRHCIQQAWIATPDAAREASAALASRGRQLARTRSRPGSR